MKPEPRQVRELIERIANLLRAEGQGLRAQASGPLLPVQLHVLDYLARCNRYSDGPVAVAEYLGITKGTTSQTVRTLERRGFLRRSEHPGDGRRVRLSLTAAGRRVARAVAAPELLRAAVADLGREAADLERLLESLLRGLQRRGGFRTFGACRTCRHFQTRSRGRNVCGLTGEALSQADSRLICREHEMPAAP